MESDALEETLPAASRNWTYTVLVPFPALNTQSLLAGRVLETTRGVANTFGQRQLAAAAGVSPSELSAVLLGKRRPSPSTVAKLGAAASRLQRAESEEAEQTERVLDEVRRHCELTGLRRFVRRARIDPANLNRVLKGRGEPSRLVLAKLQALLARS